MCFALIIVFMAIAGILSLFKELIALGVLLFVALVDAPPLLVAGAPVAVYIFLVGKEKYGEKYELNSQPERDIYSWKT